MSGNKGFIGRYEVVSKAGAGAFGVVYRARDPLLDRDVAIKVPKVSQLSPEEVARVTQEFYHEASIAGRFTHPNIVTIYDVGRDESLDFMVMEYVPGRSVQDYIKQTGPTEINEAIDIGYKCCMALDYTHFHGVVHRDIKPDNIMYNPAHGLIKLMDFSIAHKLEDQPAKDMTTVTGTISYMAPEHFDKTRIISSHADIFALGSTLYQLLTGKTPFRGDMKQTVRQIRFDQAQSVRELRPEVPIALEDVINKAMAKQEVDRFESALEFAEALTDVRKSLHVPSATDQPDEFVHEEMESYLTMRRSEWFQNFSPEQVNELLQIGSMVRYQHDEVIIAEGTGGDTFYLMLEGAALVHKDGIEVARMGIGTCFGESSLIGTAPRSATVKAIGEVKLWAIRAERLNGLSTESRAGFYRTLMEVVLRRLDRQTRQVVSLKRSR